LKTWSKIDYEKYNAAFGQYAHEHGYRRDIDRRRKSINIHGGQSVQ